MGEWDLVEKFNLLKDIADRNKFELERGALGSVAIRTSKYPYEENVMIIRSSSICEALSFLQGYEQAKFELKNTIQG